MRKLSVVVVILQLIVSSCAFAKKPVDRGVEGPVAIEYRDVADRLKKAVAQSPFGKSEIGLWVGAVIPYKSPEVLLDKNAKQGYIPASLSKIITAGAVLNQLKPGYHFYTQLLSNAVIDQGSLKGSLCLKGGGDPSFVSENMWVLINDFLRTKVSTIEGDVIVDDKRFDAIRFGDDRDSTRVDRAYDAPLGAMSMNWNSVTVTVRPAEKAGKPAEVFLDVNTPYLKVINDATTSTQGKNISVERIEDKNFFGDVIRVQGKVGLDQKEVVFYKSITQPDLFAGYNLVDFLSQRGVKIRGSVRVGACGSNDRVLAQYESKPLGLIIMDMAKFSNNYVAEMLVKGIAAEAGHIPATTEKGINIVQQSLEKMGWKPTDFKFINASGFTRDNKLTPAQIGNYLASLHDDFSISPEFLSALPIAGIDGTLKSRMKGTKAQGWVRAKTGLLNGVVGLAGFAGRSDGRFFAFAFIYNGPGQEDKAREFFDRLAVTLAE